MVVTLRYKREEFEQAVNRITGIRNASAYNSQEAVDCFRLMAKIALNTEVLPFNVKASHYANTYEIPREWHFQISSLNDKGNTIEFVATLKLIQKLMKNNPQS